MVAKWKLRLYLVCFLSTAHFNSRWPYLVGNSSLLFFSLHAVESVLLVNINPDSINSQDQTWNWQQFWCSYVCCFWYNLYSVRTAFAKLESLIVSWEHGIIFMFFVHFEYFRWNLLIMLLSYCTRAESCNNLGVWILSSNLFNRTFKL